MSRPAASGVGSVTFADGTLDPGRWTTFENVASLASTLSSNDLARELIDFYFQEEQILPPTILVAEEQRRARGRNGREWKAPKGRGLYLTFVRRVGGHEPLPLLTVAVARWVKEAIQEVSGLAARLKWPNDLYVGRLKLGGVLAEARTQGDDSYLAVGIGINVRGASEELGVPHATTVEQETGRSIPLASLLQAVVDRLDRGLADPEWAREVEEWESASIHRPGDRMRVRAGGKEVIGEYRGLDPSGFLKLVTPGGETIVSAGELEEW
ncbi:MAG TPA: biotin--[acetyl-CoA-carboxylase] ligase [Thermoanaerobaculia bacterium]|jgi:BirA family biotin operon repressor/biotin-[acetyl-CoA-carboxylase] ligase|nr:biotin--[acetyl-CoA-carboxylase] ligase [Thermoanaerobaculia bacterium]HEV8610854.1 biotin--[acetyl-CoA-carboxylase] ligase [Thermoanaerobaculia bacterium]